MARVQHTCTGCVPIDASIIDVYVTLVNTNKHITIAETERAAAEDARETAETGRASLFATDHGRAVADHSIAESDHRTASADHASTVAVIAEANAAAAIANAKAELVQARLDTADADHTRAEGDHGTAVSDHSTASTDHTMAQSDHETAGNDHTRAESDHSIAASDHTASASATAAATGAAELANTKAGLVQEKLDRADTEHDRAESDHTIATSDHTAATADHAQASADHTQAGTDHGTAVADHTSATDDHTQAGQDHTLAAADHVTAGEDHTQALADHQVLSGYDTRLTNAETEVSQLRQEVDGVQTKNYDEGKYINKLGNLIQNEDWGVSDFIPYSQGNSVVWTYGGGIYSNACICFFNSQKQFITYWEASSNTGTKTISSSEIAQWAANGAFIRASFRLANMETAGVVTGNTTWNPENTQTEGLSGKITRLEEEKQDVLTFDSTPTPGSNNPVTSEGVYNAIKNIDFEPNFTKNKYINYNGSVSDSVYWNLSNPIPYESGSAVLWRYGTPNAEPPCLVFLNSSKQFISGAYWPATDVSGQRTISAADITRYAPNAAYLRASFHKEYADAMVMVGDSVWTPNPGVEFDPTSVIDGIAKNSFHSVYCTESVTAKQKEFCALFKSAGIADAFVFMTDPHLMGSENTFNEETAFRPYLSVLQKYKNSIPASFLLCGGDWLNNKDYQDFACWKLGIVDSTMRKLFPRTYRPVLGNHDTNYYGYVSSEDQSNGLLPHDALRGLMFNEESNTYYDFYATNGHYFVLDTGDDATLSMTSFRWEQIAWLAQKLQNNNNDNVVVVMHIYSNAGEASTWAAQKSQMANNVQNLLGAYNSKTSVSLNGISYSFTNAVGKCRCIVCGHSHFDHIDTSGNVPVICTTNFTSGGTPTFDMMLIDYTAGVLTAIRVGTGNNRTMNLA